MFTSETRERAGNDSPSLFRSLSLSVTSYHMKRCLDRTSRSHEVWLSLIRFFCGAAAQFAVRDLSKDAVAFRGHELIPTTFKYRTLNGELRIHYCRCGKMALRDGKEFSALDGYRSRGQMEECRLARPR